MPVSQSPPPITERTFAVVQDLMRQEGLKTDDPNAVALYVEQLIGRERFFRTSDRLRDQVAHIPPDELQRMIDEAVDEVEQQYRSSQPSASRS
jgi:hypothetical protein